MRPNSRFVLIDPPVSESAVFAQVGQTDSLTDPDVKAPLTGLAPRGPAIESPLARKARPRRVIVGRKQRHRVEQDAETTAVVNRPADLDR